MVLLKISNLGSYVCIIIRNSPTDLSVNIHMDGLYWLPRGKKPELCIQYLPEKQMILPLNNLTITSERCRSFTEDLTEAVVLFLSNILLGEGLFYFGWIW